MTKIILDKKGICEYQKNRDPYLMIDYASEIIPGKSAKGYKDLKDDEWFFTVHWKNNPNMPGMLQTEALVQMAALSILSLEGNKGKVMYLTSANNLKFIKKIIPNSRLYIDTEIKINDTVWRIAEYRMRFGKLWIYVLLHEKVDGSYDTLYLEEKSLDKIIH